MKVITEKSVTLFDNLRPVVITDSHPMYHQIREHAIYDELEEALELANPKKAVTQAISGTKLTLEDDDTVTYNGTTLPQTLANRILDLMEEEAPLTYLENFVENLLQNPSYRAVKELYDFLEASNLPITQDGHFVAYKSVRSDYTDHHTGKMDNSIGAQPTMPRNTVDEDKNRTCSAGLHFAAYEYASGFGGGHSHLMAVKINPKDVVAIPSDYNNQKGRACTYLIIDEIENKQDTLATKSVY